MLSFRDARALDSAYYYARDHELVAAICLLRIVLMSPLMGYSLRAFFITDGV
jgi:hypothetical protein